MLSRPDDGGCSLGGEITLPPGDGPAPGVVVVHRAGPHDRDGAVGPNRPYRDLARRLAASGVATLRYEKRSLVCDLSKDEQSLHNVVVADAAAAVDRLAAVDRVTDVALFGHGLGGVAAPLVAPEAATDVAGLILAATPTRPLSEVFLATERRKAEADGRITVEERQRLDFVREKLEQSRRLAPDDDYYILGTSTAFWRDLHDQDVVAAVRARPEPAVALHPGRGFVTTPADVRTWRRHLPHGSVRTYPTLDHLFMRVFDDSLPEAYFFPDTVARAVPSDVATWLRGVVG
jgi:pimeloyl-ACP methyl ester carboxylesterase